MDLLFYIESEYGLSAVKLLKEKNKHFDTPGRIDIKTLEWIKEIKIKNKYNLSNFIYVLGGETELALGVHLDVLISQFNYEMTKTIPVFESDIQLSAFINKLKEKQGMIDEIIKKRNVSHLEASVLYDGMYKHVVDNRNYLVSLENANKVNKTPIIHISGFKEATEHGLVTVDDALLTPGMLASELKMLKLPNFATVKLDICLHGCENYPLALKKIEVLEMIDDSKIDFLQQHFQTDFLNNTLNEYKKNQTLFSGKFVGQLGEKHKYVDNIKYFDGHFGSGNSHIVFASDDGIFIDEKALTVEAGTLPFFNRVESKMQDQLQYSKMKYIRSRAGKYYEINVGSDPKLKTADGSFIFVIPLGYPSTVLFYECTLNSEEIGHSSLSRGRSVHFAGEAKFNNGELVYWSNSSGHYRPTATAIHHLSDLIQLLPIAKFKAHIDT